MKSSSDKQAIIFLKDISYEDLQGLVDYMYKVCLFSQLFE